MININRSQPAPECLSKEKKKKNGDYKCGDVIERLHRDFYNKCYLCEEKAPSTINVEHRIPHKGSIELKFDWNNLFWSCGHCNNTKLGKYENVIDCTINSINVLDLLKFEMNPFPFETARISPLNEDHVVVETARLLNEIYNGTTKLKITEGLNIKNKILQEIIAFNELLQKYFFEEGLSGSEKEITRIKIRRKLGFDSAFSAFKIWVIKNNQRLLEEFSDLIPQIEN
ncbi:MAG: HNH endonuclease [Bacteroidales bacterium]|nr:HNH endonuclease [Bacteroidales bacterium]MCF8458311.1 HNH endonuclease [Bacteroidales bacterium]